jgi:hypothetical protein
MLVDKVRDGPTMNELLEKVAGPIKELRNSRNLDENWKTFRSVVETNQDSIVANFSLRWLRSICDTYADFGDALERRDALAISSFINMVRLAETVRYMRGPVIPEKLEATRSGRVELYEELFTFHIHKQDVFLNMAKRMARQLQGTGLMEKIWREVIKRFLRGDNVITELQSLSDMPERYFPLEPLGVKDNYGVI